MDQQITPFNPGVLSWQHSEKGLAPNYFYPPKTTMITFTITAQHAYDKHTPISLEWCRVPWDSETCQFLHPPELAQRQRSRKAWNLIRSRTPPSTEPQAKKTKQQRAWKSQECGKTDVRSRSLPTAEHTNDIQTRISPPSLTMALIKQEVKWEREVVITTCNDRLMGYFCLSSCSMCSNTQSSRAKRT